MNCYQVELKSDWPMEKLTWSTKSMSWATKSLNLSRVLLTEVTGPTPNNIRSPGAAPHCFTKFVLLAKTKQETKAAIPSTSPAS